MFWPTRCLLPPRALECEAPAIPGGGSSRRWRRRGASALACAAALAGSAGAQTVTLFGLVDVAVEHVGQVGPARSGLRRMPGLTGSAPSRLGVRGSEDLGGGLRAVFTLEQGFTPDSGAPGQGGRGWGRQAFVGLAGPWGTLTFGRQYTMLFWSILDADVLGPNLYGTGSLDPYIPNARADNALAWRGAFAGLVLGATTSPGRDTVNAGNPAGTNCAGESAADARACREWSLLAKFDTAAAGAALAIDEIRGGSGAFAGLTASALKDTRVSLNGYVKRGDLKASLGLVWRDNGASPQAPRSDLWYAGAVFAASPALTLEAEWLILRLKGSVDGARLGVLRVTHALSRRTAAYATAGHIANQGALALSVSAGAPGSNPLPGTAQTGLAAGVRHSF